MPLISPQKLLLTIYLFLNSLRLFTISSLIIGLISQLITMIINIKIRLSDLSAAGGISLTGNSEFYSGTDLITLSGGVAGFGVAHSLSVIIIFLSLLSEIPTPNSIRLNKKLQSFWNKILPSFGVEYGKGLLGLLILLIGSFELSMNEEGFTRVASWFLFIAGIFNLLLGITLGSDIHTYRSISHLSSLSPSPSSPPTDLESQIPPPTISFSSTPQQNDQPRSPLNLNFSRFIPPSFRRNSVQSDSIYSQQDNFSQYPNSTRHQFQSFSNHHQDNSENDAATGYMSETGRGDSSPRSMQQAFSARNFEIVGPMEQVGRGRRLGDY